MTVLRDAVLRHIAEVDGRMTIRHLFYRLATEKIIDKSEVAYGNLCRHLSVWRKAGSVPFSAFVDSTRWYYGSTGHDSLEDALVDCANTYRKNYWRNSGLRIEVWCEKDTIASLLTEAAAPYGVQVFVCRGFASLSSLYDAAEQFKRLARAGYETHILYFGDRDPSGVLVDQNIGRAMRETFGVEVNLRRVAVTEAQISGYNLPTRPTKAKSSHMKSFVGESVEIDAMHPADIKNLVQEALEDFMDPAALQSMKVAEESERQHLYSIAGIGGVNHD